MGVKVVYKEASDHAREVTMFLRDFEHRTGVELETIDPETRGGADFCRVYDIVEYPTLIATDTTGVVLNSWRGTPLPTIDEVSFYVQ